MPELSIVTVVLNGAATIQQCINSVNNPNYANRIEHIIIDGGSKDKTVALVEKAMAENENLKLWCIPGLGIYQSMNRGIQVAEGKFILFLNADDYIAENGIKIALEYIEKYDSSTLICLSTELENAEHPKKVHYPITDLNQLSVPHPSTMFSANILEKFKYDAENFQYAADKDLIARIIATGNKVTVGQEVLSCFRSGGYGSRVGFIAEKENFIIDRKIFGLQRAIKNFIFHSFYKIIYKGKSTLLND